MCRGSPLPADLGGCWLPLFVSWRDVSNQITFTWVPELPGHFRLAGSARLEKPLCALSIPLLGLGAVSHPNPSGGVSSSTPGSWAPCKAQCQARR